MKVIEAFDYADSVITSLELIDTTVYLAVASRGTSRDEAEPARAAVPARWDIDEADRTGSKLEYRLMNTVILEFSRLLFTYLKCSPPSGRCGDRLGDRAYDE